MAKYQGGQTREPQKRTGARAQYQPKGKVESGAIERGAPRMGRPGGLKRPARKGPAR